MRLTKKILIIITMVITPALSFAQKNKKQKKDGGAAKEFIEVCNLYKKAPLHMEVEITQNATIRTSLQDSSKVTATFYLTEKESYTRFGNTEQIVSDSLMLMVSLDKAVMMISNTGQEIKKRLDSYMGLQMTDSLLQKLEDLYTVSYLPASTADEKVIELKNKTPLAGTDITKEIITVRYQAKSKEPSELISIKKTLIPVDKKDLEGNTAFADKLITIGGHSFLLNERRSVFLYKAIDHDPAIKVPVNLADRIRTNEQGKIVPVKGFEHYYVSVE